jgi:guanyl-specific ribonuclease Sa
MRRYFSPLNRGLSFLLAGLTLGSLWISCQLNLIAQPIVESTGILIAQMPTVRLAQLPPEAKTTLNLISKGGPFPYQKDGAIFSNREGKLPTKPRGYYREYTVPTPGASNRGTRRFVVGKKGEIYYTNNHYQSFVKVIR